MKAFKRQAARVWHWLLSAYLCVLLVGSIWLAGAKLINPINTPLPNSINPSKGFLRFTFGVFGIMMIFVGFGIFIGSSLNQRNTPRIVPNEQVEIRNIRNRWWEMEQRQEARHLLLNKLITEEIMKSLEAEEIKLQRRN